jgi:hypothetical protein
LVTLTIEKLCGCAKKAEIPQIQSFESKDTALNEANELVSEMNETFCQKHNFTLVEKSDSELLIAVGMNQK